MNTDCQKETLLFFAHQERGRSWRMDAANRFCTDLLPLQQPVTTTAARIQNISSATD